MNSFIVKNNTDEDLIELEKEGFYPGKKYMETRIVYIFIPDDVIPADSNVIDWYKNYDKDGKKGVVVFFGHDSFDVKPEGIETKEVGCVSKEKQQQRKKMRKFTNEELLAYITNCYYEIKDKDIVTEIIYIIKNSEDKEE